MTCKLCKKKPVWKFTNKSQLCANCFSQYFERKIKATIRKYNMPIGKMKKTDLNAKVINNIIEKLPVRAGKLSTENLNDISNTILYIVMYEDEKKLKSLLPKNQPLYFLSNAEILLYAKIIGIKGKIEKPIEKLKQIDDFLVSLEKKNADVRQNVVQSILKNAT